MTDAKIDTPARLGRGPKLSSIWLVPIVAVMVGIWMVYMHWAGQGPLIEVTFISGEGIEGGKTKVKMKNVDIGEVLELRLSENADQVVLSIRIEEHAAHLLREDSKFWVVRPRIGKGGVSGLSTLLSGAYIELSPGTLEQSAREFTGLDTPPVTPIGTPGLHVTLDSDGNKALNEGDPILFHGMAVGKIEYVHFNSQERRSYYNAFIVAPYDRLITNNTRFWFSSGLNLSLSADGIRVEIASLESLIEGGVAFDVPDGQPRGEPITKRAFFTIFPREAAIHERIFDHALTFVILFDDSIRGLKVGAPVEYRGIKVGHVVRTDIDYPQIKNLLDPTSKIPVIIEIVPARLGFADDESVLGDVASRIDDLIKGGLRGGLATGSILTGRKFIELQYHDVLPGDRQTFGEFTVIPSINGGLGQLMANAERTLRTINNLPLDRVAVSMHRALDEVAATLAEFRKSASELEDILADPASHELVDTLNATLTSFQELARDFSEGSATHAGLQQSLRSLDETLKELEPVLRNIRRKPNSLIFGGSEEKDLEPEGADQ